MIPGAYTVINPLFVVVDTINPYGDSLSMNLDRNQKFELTDPNEEAKRLFLRHAEQTQTNVYGLVAGHVDQQLKTYQHDTYTAAIDSEMRAAQTNWNDMPGLAGNMANIDSYTQRLADLTGHGPLAPGLAQKSKSDALNGAIANAMQLGNQGAVLKILHDLSPHMDPNDMVATYAKLQQAQQSKMAMDIGLTVGNEMAGRMNPPTTTRLLNLIGQRESGNQHFGKDGLPMRSGAGAVGHMQIMPDSAPEDARAAGLPWNPELFTRAKTGDAAEDAEAANYNLALGTAHFVRNLANFRGDPQKAVAAYNAGDGAVKAAVARAEKEGGDWLTYLPKETQEYTGAIMTAFNSGAGVGARPSEADYVSAAEKQYYRQAGALADPKGLKAAREEAQYQYQLQDKQLKQQADGSYLEAMRQLQSVGGRYAALPQAVRANLESYAPDKIAEVQKEGARIIKGEPVETNWSRYAELRAMAATDHSAFKKYDLEMDFNQLAPQQREQLLDLQTKLNDTRTAPTVVELGSQLTTAHNMLKLTDMDQKGIFDNAVALAIAAEAKHKGRDLGFEERDKIIKRMMLPVDSGHWYVGNKMMYQVMGTADQGKGAPVISKDDRALISQALENEGRAVTEENILARFKARYGL